MDTSEWVVHIYNNDSWETYTLIEARELMADDHTSEEMRGEISELLQIIEDK